MPCKMCKERTQTWNGDPPDCAFETGIFSVPNWNCATVNAIRDICYEGQQEMPKGVDYQYCMDMKYANIRLDDIGYDFEKDEQIGDYFAMCLFVVWYKNRGGTDALWLMDSYKPPRKPTEEECVRIIQYYKDKVKTRW